MRWKFGFAKRFSVYKKLIFSHLAIELVVLMAFVPLLGIVLSSARNQQMQEALLSAQTSVTHITNEFENATELMVLLSSDRTVSNISRYRNVAPQKYYSAAFARQALRIPARNWKLLNDFYLFFSNNEIVLSADRIWFSYHHFYGAWLRYEGMDLAAWKESVRQSIRYNYKHTSAVQKAYSFFRVGEADEMRDVITYTLPVPGISAIAVFLVDAEALMQALGVGERDFLAIDGPDGAPLLRYRAPEHYTRDPIQTLDLDGVSYTAFSIDDPAAGLTFTIGQPTASIQGALSRLAGIISVYMIAVVVVSTVLSGVFAYHEYTPIKKLNAAVKNLSAVGHETSNNEYESLFRMFFDMHRHNQGFSEEILRFNQEMRRRALEDLLWKRYATAEELCRLEQHITLPMEYRLGIARVQFGTSRAGYSIANASLMNEMSRVFHVSIHLLPMAEDQLIFIIPDDLVRERLEEVKDHTIREWGSDERAAKADLFLAVSQAHQGAENLHTAFEEARSVLAQRYQHERSVVMFRGSDDSEADPMLSSEGMGRLKEIILLGDTARALATIRGIFEGRFFRDGDFSQLYYDVRNALLHAQSGVREENRTVIPYYSPSLGQDEQIAALLEACEMLCRQCEEKKKSHNQDLNNAIVQYLKDHYTRTDVYGKSVALRFGIHEKYLYSFFKEQNGVSFASYLEELRLSQAELLLRNTKHSVSEIASMVGFNTSNTFYKAFLRVNGVSPSEYRSSGRRE